MEFSALAQIQEIEKRYASLEPEDLLRALWTREFSGRIALVSSFGAEAAILLYYAARVDKAFPVIFLDTQKLFPETLEYRDRLIARLALTNVKTIYPDYAQISRADPDGTLWQTNPRMCCTLRKVNPLTRALKNFDAWITGRKRYHGGMRTDLPFAEVSDGKIKINPLADWSAEKIKTFFEEENIPQHPLVMAGYTSIGCVPCTALPSDPSDARSGRWAGQNRTECGIHLEGGKLIRVKPA